MKTYLPHYFKRIGILFVLVAIVLSFTSGIDDFRKGFMEGYTEQQGINEESAKETQSITPYLTKVESEKYANISLFFSIIGFFLYLFSKEKIDDEFMQHLRLKSILQAFIFSWLIYATMKCAINIIPLDGIYILQMQLIVYVIIFRYNKNRALSEEEEDLVLED